MFVVVVHRKMFATINSKVSGINIYISLDFPMIWCSLWFPQTNVCLHRKTLIYQLSRDRTNVEMTAVLYSI